MVEEEDVAYHAPPWNCRSFGIEHEGKTWESNWATDPEYVASARLTRYLCWYYGIARDRTAIVGHTEVPGTDTTEHPDPGTYWAWTYYMALVQDDTPPSVQVVSCDRNGTSVTVTWYGSDGGYTGAGIDHYERWMDSGSPVETTATSATFSGLTGGFHTVHVRAYDKLLNSAETSAGFVIDTTPPVTSLSVTSPDGRNGWYITRPWLLLSPDETATVYYHWDSQPDQSDTRTIQLIEGIHTLYYHSVDQAGNVEATRSRQFKVDAHVETSSLNISPTVPDGNAGWYRTVPTITLSATGGATIYYNWDYAANTAYSSPVSASAGTHTIYFHSEDEAGNTEWPNKSQTVKTDPSAPSVSVSSVSTSQNQATVQWSGSDEQSGIANYEIKLDAQSWVSLGLVQQHAFTGLANGQHTAYVRATDAAGNSAQDSRSFAIDLQANPPTVTINPIANNRTNQTSPTLTGTASDAGSGGSSITSVQYQMDGTGGSWTAASMIGSGVSVTWQATVGPLSANAMHTIWVRASDGTYTSNPVAYSFFVDTVAPQLVVARSLGNTLVEVTFNEAMAAAGAGNNNYYSIPGLTVSSASLQPDGRTVQLTTSAQTYSQSYTLTVTGVTDVAGNPLGGSNQTTFTGLPAGPVVVSVLPADGATSVATNATITATFNTDMQSSTINGSTFYVIGPTGQVSGTVSYSTGTRTAVFTPGSALAEAAIYTATITTACQDTGGASLVEQRTWSFVTGSGAGFAFNWTVNVNGMESWSATEYPSVPFDWRVKGTATERWKSGQSTQTIWDAKELTAPSGKTAEVTTYGYYSTAPNEAPYSLTAVYGGDTAELYLNTSLMATATYGNPVSGNLTLQANTSYTFTMKVIASPSSLAKGRCSIRVIWYNYTNSEIWETDPPYPAWFHNSVSYTESPKDLGQVNVPNATPQPMHGGSIISGPSYTAEDNNSNVVTSLVMVANQMRGSASTSYSQTSTGTEQRQGSAQGGPIMVAPGQEYRQAFGPVVLQPQHAGTITGVGASESDDSSVVDSWVENLVCSDATRSCSGTVVARLETVSPQTQISLTGSRLSNPQLGRVFLGPDARVQLSATDDAAGVAWTRYRIDGGPLLIYTTPISITGTGDHTVEYFSTDRAGNEESVKRLEHLIVGVPLADCDGNLIPDDCDLDSGDHGDVCNFAGAGTRRDCNHNHVPDTCDISAADPDGNGHVSSDNNSNGVPDECESMYDLDNDSRISPGDLSYLACCWLQASTHSGCGGAMPCNKSDFDCDGFVGVGDLSYWATGWLKSLPDPTIKYPPCHGSGVMGMMAPLGDQMLMQAMEMAAPPQLHLALRVIESPTGCETTSLLPDSLSSAPLGSQYNLGVWVSGMNHEGVTSVYVDVEQTGVTSSVIAVSQGSPFATFASGVVVPTGIDELGGSSLSAGVGTEPEWACVGMVTLQADTAGTVTFSLRPSTTGCAVYGRGTVPWSDITLESAAITQGPPQTVQGDFDHDGNVDSDDLGLFDSCASGPAIPLAAGCEDRDLDHDNDVDQSDFGFFQASYSKPR